MSKPHVKYLLVGGGLAAASAAKAIRQLDSEGTVLLIGQESSRPYHRPPLSKEFLRRQQRRDELFAIEPGWLEQNHVELRSGHRVAGLDVIRKAAVLHNGEEISYDRLLLSTGASPKTLDCPGATLPNIYYLRTVEDVDRLHIAIDKARHEGRPHPGGGAKPVARGRVAVIGAGLLGVELAASLTQLGMAVDLLASSSHPWNRFAGESTGKFLQLFLERHGVTVHPNARPIRLEGDGRVQRVVINGAGSATRSLDCDFAVACVGATVNKDLLRGTPIAAGKAILVDDHCRTNIEGAYAAGDCCAILDPLFGKHRQLDHWDNAQVTGTLAGRNMAGANESYRAVNYFFSDVFDLSLGGWGEARQVDRRLLHGTPRVESCDFTEIGVAADGRVAQVLVVRSTGQSGDDDVLREFVGRRVRLDGKEERLKDPAYPVSELLK
jgi:3-phenylpropionate/trans-cinnamate dioxygenase ferredoxin reductase subunit